jgi:hypothetical protein
VPRDGRYVPNRQVIQSCQINVIHVREGLDGRYQPENHVDENQNLALEREEAVDKMSGHWS